MSLLGVFMERLMWQVVCGSVCPWLTLGGNNWQVILELKYSSSCPHLRFPHFSPLSTSERAEMAWTKAGDRRRRRQERREGRRVVETQKHCRCGHPNIIISAAQTGPEDRHASPLSSSQASQASSLLPQSVLFRSFWSIGAERHGPPDRWRAESGLLLLPDPAQVQEEA